MVPEPSQMMMTFKEQHSAAKLPREERKRRSPKQQQKVEDG
jgi:hypothetical protein